MLNIKERNVNGAYGIAMYHFDQGTFVNEYPSRNGTMLELDTPVVTSYLKPTERVLFDPVRDCNPFLHFFECLWMLAGRRDVKYMTQFSKTFESFSDDGVVFNAAYGHRWRHHFRRKSTNELHEEIDQLDWAIKELRKDPMSRRVVTQMWDGSYDIGLPSRDLPCNTSVMWRLRDGVLDMTVTNRSNDAVWGCYGANAVHFSFLHEYVSGAIGAKVGTYYQFSNSLHIYPELPVVKRIMAKPTGLVNDCPYGEGLVKPFPIYAAGETVEDFDSDLAVFMSGANQLECRTQFFGSVVWPMWLSFKAYKGGADSVRAHCDDIQASDWQKAVSEWLDRRGVA